jgi:DNA-binding transcriptional ArsR family regulator
MDAELLTALKALSDASRLRIVGLLADGRKMSVEDLSAALSLTPGTVVHHLKRLREADLVDSQARPPYMDYSLRIGRLGQIGQELHRMAREQAGESTEPTQRPEWASEDEGRTLRAFFDGDRLLSIPAQHSKRLIVLRQLAETVFERKRKYPEKEVNQLLGARYPDAASLRRYLVDEGFMTRKNSVYRLRPRKTWPQRPGAVDAGADDQRSRANVTAEIANAPAS